MRPSAIACALVLIAGTTPVCAEQAVTAAPVAEVRQAETVQASADFERAVRRSVGGLGRLRLHPARDAVDSADLQRGRTVAPPSD